MTTARVLVLDQAIGLWGAQRYLLRLAGPLLDHDVELVLGSPQHLDLAQAWQTAGLPFVHVPLPTQRSLRVDGDKGRLGARAVLREVRGSRDVVRMIADAARAVHADVIHANGHGVHLDAALGGRSAGLPVVLHLHEELQQATGRAIRAASVGLATASVAVSRAVADGVPRALRSRVTVVPNGVDTVAIKPGPRDGSVRAGLGAGPDEVLLLALTRLDPEKRIEDLIAALGSLRHVPGWHLSIAGETSSYAEYATTVRALADDLLPGRVTFAGRRSDVCAVLRASDILVHAGVVEGMPLGLLEAQAAGLPVVAYRVAGVPEAVIDGVTGLLAGAGDCAELGRHIATLLDDPLGRHRMGSMGRRHVEATHTIEGQAAAYAQHLARVATTHRSIVSVTP